MNKAQRKLQNQGQQSFPAVNKPWGGYQDLDAGPSWKTKRMWVEKGAVLSLQSHKLRAEHWVVVSGVATVTLDGKEFDVPVGEGVYIPLGAVHRLANTHDALLQVVETQIGTCDETDITRYEDIYGREGTRD